MSDYSYVTFDITPHRIVLLRGVTLLDDISTLLDFRIVPGILPTYKFVKKRVFTMREMIADYLLALESITGDESYRTEFDIPTGGFYVGYDIILEVADEVKKMKEIYRHLQRISRRARRTTMRYSALTARNYVRASLKGLVDYGWNH